MWKLSVIFLLLCPVWAAGGSRQQRIGFTLENQFRKEVNDGEGGVLGEYGMRTGDGCLRVTKFKATPTGGFQVLSTHKEDCDPVRQLRTFERTKKPQRPKQQKVIGELEKKVLRADIDLPAEIPSPPSTAPSQSPGVPPSSPSSPSSSAPHSPLPNVPSTPPHSPLPNLPSTPPSLKPQSVVKNPPAVAELAQTFDKVPEVNVNHEEIRTPDVVRGSALSDARPSALPLPSITPAPVKPTKPKSVQSPDRAANLPKQLKEFDYDSLSGDSRARILDGKDDPVYSFGFTAPGHGHTQAGLPDGTKKGEYYFDSPDGWRRIVTYEANENGFFPKMRRIRIPGWVPPPPPPRRVRNRGPSRGGDGDRPEGGGGKGIDRNGQDGGPGGRPDGGNDSNSDGGPDGGPDGRPVGGPDGRPVGGPDGRPDSGRPDGGPDGRLDGRIDGRPDGELDGERGPDSGDASPGKDGLNNGDADRDTGKQLLKELEQKGGVGSCPYYFFYSTKVNFHWERCMENGTKVGQYGKLHEDGYSYRTSYYADSTGYHPTNTKTFLTDTQRALVHDFVRGVFIIPQVDEERKRTEQRILQWLEDNSELLADPLRELASA